MDGRARVGVGRGGRRGGVGWVGVRARACVCVCVCVEGGARGRERSANGCFIEGW